jgi:hypothetical protein
MDDMDNTDDTDNIGNTGNTDDMDSMDARNKSRRSFDSFTMSAFSIFLRTSQLSRKNFTILLRILRHHQFNVADLPGSYVDARRTLSDIPTLPLHVRSLPSNKRKGSGRSDEEFKQVYTHSLSALLRQALTAPSLGPQMYFGPGIKVEKPKELWHGTLWMESSLFGAGEVSIDGKLHDNVFHNDLKLMYYLQVFNITMASLFDFISILKCMQAEFAACLLTLQSHNRILFGSELNQ